MRKVPVSGLAVGMSCTAHVYFGNGQVLVAAGVPISEADLRRLERWGVTEVETEGEFVAPSALPGGVLRSALASDVEGLYKDLAANLERTAAAYQEMVDSLRFVLAKAKGSKELDEGRLKGIFRTLFEELTERKPLLLSQLLSRTSQEYLLTHSVNVAVLSALVGVYMGFDKERLGRLVKSALLHNIGMTVLPLELLHREGEMSPKERMQLRTHPLHGYRILKEELKADGEAAETALMHHERWDGTGYPRGLKADSIGLFARIVAVADAFTAMVVDREYRKHFTSYDAMRQVVAEAGTHFDPEVVKAFVEAMSLYPVGTRVVLNNGCSGIVVESNDTAKLRPVVKLLTNEQGVPVGKRNILVDLKDERSLFITRVLAEGEEPPGPKGGGDGG